MIASMPPTTASRPYFVSISRKRRSPVFTAAIWARKSPIARSGSRTLVRMIETSSSLMTPLRYIFTIGICRPSEKMSVVAPSSVPPTSGQCAMQQENATSSPSQNTGTVNVMWLRWLPVM